MTSTVRTRWAAAPPTAPRRALAQAHPGTNGWLSSWGTNAHGEIAGTPPSGR